VDVATIMNRLDEKSIETIACQIVNIIIEDMAMMTMGGNSSSGTALAAPPSSSTGANGQGDTGVNGPATSSNSASDKEKSAQKAEALSKIALSKANISSLKGDVATRGAHTGIVKTGPSYSLKTIVNVIDSPFAGSRLQTDGKATLAGSKISIGQLN